MEIPSSTSRPRSCPALARQPQPVRVRRASRRIATAFVAIATLTLSHQVLPAQVPGAPSVELAEFGPVSVAQGIAPGPDGAVWFAQRLVGKISRITTSGFITEFTLPDTSVQPCVMTAGPDGAIWFTEVIGNKIGRITTGGMVTEYPLPTANTSPQGITAGPDGAIWFTQAAGRIGRITTGGAISEYLLPSGHDPTSITTGPDGALWFLEWAGNRIGRLTLGGIVTFFPIPTPGSGAASITAGPDGALWFVEGDANKIGRITTGGVFTEYPVPTPRARPVGITPGPDGAMWFTEGDGVKIGRITMQGGITEYVLPGGGTIPFFITVGPDGALWFTQYSKIGRMRLQKVRTGVLSHIAAGGSWTSTITLVNTSLVTVPLTVSLRGGNGAPLPLPLKVTQAGVAQHLAATSMIEATVQPKASLIISMGENLGGLSVGWAEVLSPGPVSGYAIFRTVAAGQASEGTVPLQTQFPSAMVLPFENVDGFVMGVAMANLSGSTVTVTATVWDEAGNLLGTATLNPILGGGHTSFVLHDQVGLSGGKRGIIRFQTSGTGGLAGLGLRFLNVQNTFTSVPSM